MTKEYLIKAFDEITSYDCLTILESLQDRLRENISSIRSNFDNHNSTGDLCNLISRFSNVYVNLMIIESRTNKLEEAN